MPCVFSLRVLTCLQVYGLARYVKTGSRRCGEDSPRRATTTAATVQDARRARASRMGKQMQEEEDERMGSHMRYAQAYIRSPRRVRLRVRTVTPQPHTPPADLALGTRCRARFLSVRARSSPVCATASARLHVRRVAASLPPPVAGRTQARLSLHVRQDTQRTHAPAARPMHIHVPSMRRRARDGRHYTKIRLKCRRLSTAAERVHRSLRAPPRIGGLYDHALSLRSTVCLCLTARLSVSAVLLRHN